MTCDELLQARVAWLTSAVRGLLKARLHVTAGEYANTAAGEADAELTAQESRAADTDLGLVLLRFVRKKAQRLIENFIEDRL